MIRVLIADEHSVVRQGLRIFLGSDPELSVVGAARNGAEAVELARQVKPDVILMDLRMPVMGGHSAISLIRSAQPEIEIVAVAIVLEDKGVVDAVRAGAVGCLLKDTEADELCRAVKAAAAGEVQLSPQAAARLMREVRALETPEKLPPGRLETAEKLPLRRLETLEQLSPRRLESPEKLSLRELDVLSLLVGGRSNKEIAYELTIGEKTVKTHMSNILGKLGLASRTQAALYALKTGLVPSPASTAA